MQDILRHREKLKRTYSRLLLTMSFFDFMGSISLFLSTWPAPPESGLAFAIGNTATCNVQGFAIQLGVGTPFCNCALSFYYLLVIAMKYSDAQVQRVEPLFHIVPFAFAFGTALAGFPLTLYNAAGLWCWISSLPSDCANAPGQLGAGCERGDHAWIYRWAFYYGPVWFCVICTTINMAIVTYLVWAKEQASKRFDFAHQMTSPSSASRNNQSWTDDVNTSKNASKREWKQQRRTEKRRSTLASQVFWQAFYYVLAFYVTFIVPTTLRVMDTLDQPIPYSVSLLMTICLPVQGFLNLIVYVRPRILQCVQKPHNHHPTWTNLGAVVSRLARNTASVLQSSMNAASLNLQFESTVSPFDESEEDGPHEDPCFAYQQQMEESKRHYMADRTKTKDIVFVNDDDEKIRPKNGKASRAVIMDDDSLPRDIDFDIPTTTTAHSDDQRICMGMLKIVSDDQSTQSFAMDSASTGTRSFADKGPEDMVVVVTAAATAVGGSGGEIDKNQDHETTEEAQSPTIGSDHGSDAECCRKIADDPLVALFDEGPLQDDYFYFV